jgi:hypothetical protein
VTWGSSEPDIWLRPNGDVYEYIGMYVDDLAIVAKDPKTLTDKLINFYSFKLKGTGPLTFHLGCNYVQDKADEVLCIKLTKYIAKVVDTYKRLFGSSPMHNVTSPLEKGDHPEIDISELIRRNLDHIELLDSISMVSRFPATTRMHYVLTNRMAMICGRQQ